MKGKKILQIISLLNGLVFFAPVALLVRTSKGLTISEFFILQIVLSTCIFAFEVPLGYVTDRIGYKKSLVLSQSMLFLARFLLWTANSFELFFLEAVIESFANCFSSGTIEAYIYSISPEEYGQVKAKNSNFGTVGFITSTILYSPLHLIGGVKLLLVSTTICAFFAMIFSLFLDEIKLKERKVGRRLISNKSVSWNLLKNPMIRKIGIFTLFKSIGSISMFVVNFFYIVKIQQLGMSDAWMSAIIIAYSAVEMFVPRVISFLKNILSLSKAVGVISIISACLFFYLSFGNNPITLIVMIVIPLIISTIRILLSEKENRFIDYVHLNDMRATLISLSSMGQNLVDIIFLFLANAMNHISIGIPFFLVGISFLLSFLLNKSLDDFDFKEISV